MKNLFAVAFYVEKACFSKCVSREGFFIDVYRVGSDENLVVTVVTYRENKEAVIEVVGSITQLDDVTGKDVVY